MAVLTINSAVVQNGDGTWDDRPTSSTSELVLWVRTVAGSADPNPTASPAVNGAYNTDPVVGVF